MPFRFDKNRRHNHPKAFCAVFRASTPMVPESADLFETAAGRVWVPTAASVAPRSIFKKGRTTSSLKDFSRAIEHRRILPYVVPSALGDQKISMPIRREP
jgi:hypothetical protein